MAILILAAIGFILNLIFGERFTGCLFRLGALFAFFIFCVVVWGLTTFGHLPPPSP